MAGVIFKVLILSIALSIAIKDGAPMLSITPTTMIVLITVWLPTAIVAAILAGRWQQGRSIEGTRSADRKGQP